MPIHGHTVLFCKEGFTIPEPTDKDFEELDKEEAKREKIEAAKAAALEKAMKKRGKARAVAIADLDADIGEMEAD